MFFDFQAESMYNLISLEDSDWQCHEEDEAYNVCAWNGVQCVNKFIIYIGWEKPLRMLIHSLSWLPSSLERLTLINQKVLEPLETRCLPHGLRLMTANFCNIPGEIDLTNLPRKIEELRLRKNQICGVIVLTNLPPTLRELNLGGNEVRMVVGSSNCLPKSTRRANFVSVNTHMKNGHMYYKEHKIKYKSTDGSKKDKRILLKYDDRK